MTLKTRLARLESSSKTPLAAYFPEACICFPADEQPEFRWKAEAHAAGKVLGFICHAGWVAISAKIVAGMRATGTRAIKDDLENAGAIWVDEPAIREGNVVWGRVVEDIPDFCRELVAALVEAAH